MERFGFDAVMALLITVQAEERSIVVHSFFTFFFILSSYFVVLPLRDDGAISLGLSNLPSLFLASLFLTLFAAPLSSLLFSLHSLSKNKALFTIHRFFGVSLILFFILWHASSSGYSTPKFTQEGKAGDQGSLESSLSWDNHGWLYISVRIGLFLWVALLNLITISSTWARIIDVMDSESGSRLFGFIGAGATLGQLFGSLFATGMAFLGPFLLLFAAFLMELGAQTSRGINRDTFHVEEELSPIRESDSNHENEADEKAKYIPRGSPKSSTYLGKIWPIFEGLWLTLSSTYLLHVSLFIWLSAVVSSFFYFQKVSVIATTVTSSLGRRKLFAQINSFIAIFILVGQISLTGRILTVSGVTIAICSAPFVGILNLVALAVWPHWLVVAISETLRKVVTYVVTRPGRELLFTVVSEDEKYKAKVCIDVLVQRLGDAAAAGMYKILFGTLHGKPSTVSLYALPVCLLWIVTAFSLGRRQTQLSKQQISST
ncbi:putative ADP/ATP carrier protein [Lupinus albus]|uniref:ADP,ATP carrier protein n=1 Tax=Lupinus albus TaxID=3870 RepID=A0A6A4NMZ0_LUPAL|nr:putative ADP/ATP carrier protein [Lupinus albus]